MRTACAIAAAAAATAYPAWAATKASAREEQYLRKVTYDYASCVVKQHYDLASRAIVADEGNGAIVRQYPALIDSTCMGKAGGSVQVTFGGDLFRYALADALVGRDFAASGPTDFSDRLPLAHLASTEPSTVEAKLAPLKGRRRAKAQKGYDKDLVVAWLSRYGECVVRQDPVNARLWLLTPPDGAEEISRINALRPAFAACITGTLAFNRVTMRGTVALNYYRLAMATPVPAAVRKAN